MLDSAAFLATLRGRLPSGMVLGAADPRVLYPVLPEEALANAVPERLAEFSAGRSAARAAMGMLGHKAHALPSGPDRAPVWPAGLTGSVSHCTGVCAAVLGGRSQWSGIGIDVEPDHALDQTLWEVLLCPQERGAVVTGHDVLRYFVAKEAAYKAQYSITRTLFDFQSLSLQFDGVTFQARFQTDVPPFKRMDHLNGEMIFAGGYVAALVTISA